MSSSLHTNQARLADAHGRLAGLRRVARITTNTGLVAILLWIGAMKFTSYEAAGIEPLIANSPLMSPLYSVLSVQAASNLIGVVEILTALLLVCASWSPWMGAAGAAAAMATFATTLSFLLTTPGWEPSLGGFPALSAMPGQFLLKDIALLGISLSLLADSLERIGTRSRETSEHESEPRRSRYPA